MATETRPFKILLAEDSKGDAELVRQALQQHHIDCPLHIVSGSVRAIDSIYRIGTEPNVPPLDLLLLHLRVPICRGDELLTRLRSSERYAHSRVIVMTSLSSSALREETSRHDPTLFCEKPSTLEEFLQLGSMIRRVFEQRMAKSVQHITHGGAL